MERPTTEVNLPVSGMKAVVYEYYTRGERKAIEAVMLESAVFEQKDGVPKLKSVDTTYRSRMEDKAVLLAVKNLLDKNGNVVKLDEKVLDGLAEQDFEAIQGALPGQVKKK
jgi:hypothetical protein